jgi:hypothetical protein
MFAAIQSNAQRPASASASKRASPDPVPTVKLEFSEEQDLASSGGSEIAFGPIGSSPDGAVFLETSLPSSLQTSTLSSIARVDGAYATTSFGMEKISDLHDAQLRSYYATDSLVAVLVSATRDDALSTSKHVIVVPSTGEQLEQNVKSGTRHDFIATFDRQGNYKEARELDLPFKPRRVAVFSSDLYLVIGYDTENKPTFAFVNADGSLQRLLDMEKPILGWEKMMEGIDYSQARDAGHWTKAPPQFGLAQILSFHDKLLFVWPGLTWILEIAPSGSVRRVPIHVPEGFAIDHFVPSEKMWYTSFRRYGADSDVDVENIFYEISPLNGEPVRRFDASPQTVAGIACEHDGEFRALMFDQKGLRIFKGTPRN